MKEMTRSTKQMILEESLGGQLMMRSATTRPMSRRMRRKVRARKARDWVTERRTYHRM